MKRRELLKSASLFGLGAGSMGVMSQFEALAQATAGADDYRAMVCIFMFGGNDAGNMVIPFEPAEHSAYLGARSNLGLAREALLPIAPSNTQSIRYGLHPAMGGLAGLFNRTGAASPLAVVANVGPLLVPTSKAQWEARSVPLPDNLFSHSDQQSQWQSATYERPSNGWGGRLAERLVAEGTANRGYSVLSVTGGNLWETGDRGLSAYKVSASGRFGFDFYQPGNTDPLSLAITETLAERRTHLFEQGYLDVAGRSIEVQRVLSSALEGANVTAAFPDTSLGTQLRMVARLIAARNQLGLKRQCFFCSIGGFDTHGEDQLQRQGELLGTVSDAMTAFYAATQELQVAQNVTSFTASDFGRTYASNGQGSDHGWGAHHFVMGEAVQGGRMFGTFPNPTIGGPDDSGGQGNWIPTTSTEAYAATLGRWFGADNATLAQVFPRLSNFQPNVGFLG